MHCYLPLPVQPNRTLPSPQDSRWLLTLGNWEHLTVNDHTIHTAPTDKFQFLVMCLKILQLSYSFNVHVLSFLYLFTMQYIPTLVWNSILEIYELPSSLPYKLSTNALALFSSPNWKGKKGKSSVKVHFSSPTDRSSLPAAIGNCPIGVDENIGVASSSSPLLSSGIRKKIIWNQIICKQLF